MTVIDDIAVAGELAAWEDVPRKVAFIVRNSDKVVGQVRRIMAKMPKDQTDKAQVQVYWQPTRKSLALSFTEGVDEPTKNRWANRLRTLQGVSGVEMDHDWVPRDAVRIKSSGVLGQIGGIWDGANKAIGGPNPLTNVIAGGLLGGGLGYGAGTLLEQVLPEEYFERGKLRKLLTMVGAGAPAAYGLWKGTANARMPDGKGFLRGMITSDNQPISGPVKAAVAAIQLDDRYIKAANMFAQLSQGGMEDTKSIPVDAFNQAVWNDVRSGYTAARNPYGTKSPWGDNSQQMHTPPAVGAAATAIMAGVDAQQGGGGWVSPGDIVRGLAGAGVGLVTANIAGKALGALAGLRPEAQHQLQQAGMFGGVLMSVIPPLFGR